MRSNIIAIIVVTIFFSCGKHKTGQNGEAKTIFKEDVIQFLNKKIPALQQEYKVPAVGIGLIENGELKFIEVYGEHQTGKPAPDNTLFNVASITKALTAVSVIKLVSDGKWSLDEPLTKYWVDPDIKDNPYLERITTRKALSHTIGFKNWRRMTKSGELEFDFEPGTKFQYSGEGFEYLRKAIERKFQTDWGKLMDSIIFSPVGMQDATLNWINNKDTIRFAKWYNGQGKEHNIKDYSSPQASAADDLIITVEDLAKFSIAVMDTTYLNEKWFGIMTEPEIKIHNNAKQALGWTIIENLPDSHYALNHDGGDTGVATTLILLPHTKSGIIIFTNGDNGRILCNIIVKKAVKFGKELIQKLYWGGEIPKIISLDPDTLDNYSGTYTTNQDRTLQFLVRDNALKLVGEGIPEVEIYPKSKTEFFPLDFEVFFNFEEKDGITSFKLINQGKTILKGEKLVK